jgi:hypothetical protein
MVLGTVKDDRLRSPLRGAFRTLDRPCALIRRKRSCPISSLCGRRLLDGLMLQKWAVRQFWPTRQHFLYFFPLPHGHGSLRPALSRRGRS